VAVPRGLKVSPLSKWMCLLACAGVLHATLSVSGNSRCYRVMERAF